MRLARAAAVAIGLAAFAAPSLAEVTDAWMFAFGGRLYDNWLAELEADTPKASHPAYPGVGRKKGLSTWRCKECHGWDYRGKDGAYAGGSHFTGIKGVRGAAGLAPEKIRKIIMNDTHGFTAGQLPPEAMKSLVMFLRRGQVDTERYIDRESHAARGDPGRGAPIFQTICAVCHGLDGKEINFGDEAGPEYLGAECAGNPWEALHKIRFGQPGVSMVSLASLGIDAQVDVLAYCQTLPKK